MRTGGVFLLVILFCLCSADTDLHCQLDDCNHDDQEGPLELSLNHHEDQHTHDITALLAKLTDNAVAVGVFCLLLVAGMTTAGLLFSAKPSASGDKMEEDAAPGQGPVPVIPIGPQESLAIPYEHTLRNGVYDKLLVTICGTMKPKPTEIAVDFMNENRDIAFHFKARFNSQVVVGNSRLSGHWGLEQKESTFPFTAGQAFEIKVTCTSQEFEVAVNGAHLLSYKHRMPDLQSITRLRVQQDLTLSSVTETRLP